MKKLALLLTVATFAITSCNENKPAEEATEAVAEAPVEAAPMADSTTAAPAPADSAATK